MTMCLWGMPRTILLMAEPGDDTIIGGSGSDTVDYSARTSSVTVNLTDGTGGTVSENESLSSIENVIGGSGNDTIVGDIYDNTFIGGAGDDSFDGKEGTDTVDLSDHTEDIIVNYVTGSIDIGTSETDYLYPI